MKNVLWLAVLLVACKKEPEKQLCWDCVQKITKIEGTKFTETKSTKEACSIIVRNAFEETFTYSRDYGTFKEFSVMTCTQKP